MKKILLSFAMMGLGLTLSAQTNVIDVHPANTSTERVLTMEEAILARELYPQSMRTIWRPGNACATYVEGNSLIGYVPSAGTKSPIITLDELNSITGLSLEAFPMYSWKSEKQLNIFAQGRVIILNLDTRKVEVTFNVPEGAENFTAGPAESYAYTKGNNLYFCDSYGNEYPVTADTDLNIVNGKFVSRNEFGISGGIFWSNSGNKLGFYRKDETMVHSFPLLDINTRTGELFQIKYPMAGMSSENVQFGVYDLSSNKTLFLNVDEFGYDQYLTNIAWTPDDRYILIHVLDRAQKNMKLNVYDAESGAFVKTLLEEHDDDYVEPLDPVHFLKSDDSRFIYRTNNRDGYRNLYLCDMNGNITRLTKTDADVEYVGQDAKNVYYTSAEVSPIENHLFAVNIKSGKARQLTTETGWHNVSLSGDGKYFVDKYSSLNTPGVIDMKSTDGKFSENIFTAEDPTKNHAYCEIDLGTVKSADGRYDNYYRLIKPMNFDPNKKYPVIVYVYGGPHSQLVKNTWLGELRNWEMLMAQKGYVVYIQDNRGTLNRGIEFEQAIHGQCGQLEMADQMEGVKMLMSLPYVDTERIGVHGWSYGGFMTISLTTNYPDIFKVAVAGGPVIDWKWYEIMYGERYMDNPNTNAEGYEKVSLLHKAKDLKSKLLICQGAVDNVVVWEHSLSFIRQCIINHVQVDYFPYPCAQHNVLGRDRVHLMDKVTLYFEDYL